MIALELDGGAIGRRVVDGSAAAERGLELLHDRGQFVGRGGSCLETHNSGHDFPSAFLAADSQLLGGRVEDPAGFAGTRASARRVRLAASLARDGLFERCSSEETCHERERR
mgnify:CR=1 FL=1